LKEQKQRSPKMQTKTLPSTPILHPYNEGYAACDNGALITDNPYQHGTPDFLEWERGYQSAYESPF